MKISNKDIFIIITTLLSIMGCGYDTIVESYNPAYNTELSVFSIISTDNNFEFVIVEETMALSEYNEEGNSQIVDDAEVFVINNLDTTRFRFYRDPNNYYSYSGKGMYIDRNNEFLAVAGKTYKLLVKVPDGRIVTGSTTVPENPVISQPADLTIIPLENLNGTKIDWDDVPKATGYRINFIVEIPGYNEKINLLTDYYTAESHASLEYIDEFFLFNNYLPPTGIATIQVLAMDQNSYDYLLKNDLASYIGTDLNILEGGLGAFGSFSTDYVRIKWTNY